MKVSSVEICTTQDGSHSLISENEGVLYRSKYGAVTEAKHVFIEAGLFYKSIEKKSIRLLEVGFGTGLNAFLSFIEAKKYGLEIHYLAIEANPIPLEIAGELNYPQVLKAQDSNEIFMQLHLSDWGTEVELAERFTFTKINDKVQNIHFEEQFDLIYFDVFAPDFDPELWERPMLEKMFYALLPGGIMVTYCAKGEFKRTLKAIGFQVEALQGSPGKREMTRAKKNH